MKLKRMVDGKPVRTPRKPRPAVTAQPVGVDLAALVAETIETPRHPGEFTAADFVNAAKKQNVVVTVKQARARLMARVEHGDLVTRIVSFNGNRVRVWRKG